MSEEALQNSCEKKISEKQRRKGKIYHLNAEFQRIARRDKKAFLSEQCKEIEERLGKTRDLVKKIRDTKGNISLCKDGHNKVQKWYGPNRRADDIKKRWQEYTEELYEKHLFLLY